MRHYIPCTCAALPQLDRGSDYESERHRFESCTPHHLDLKAGSFGSQPFFVYLCLLQHARLPGTPLCPSLSINRAEPPCHLSQKWSTRGNHRRSMGYTCLNVHNCAFSQKRARSVGEAWRRQKTCRSIRITGCSLASMWDRPRSRRPYGIRTATRWCTPTIAAMVPTRRHASRRCWAPSPKAYPRCPLAPPSAARAARCLPRSSTCPSCRRSWPTPSPSANSTPRCAAPLSWAVRTPRSSSSRRTPKQARPASRTCV